MSLNLSIEAIEAIDAISRKGSFAAAAESLFRVPSALTYTIKKLEGDLNVKIFDRSGHRASLTEAGKELLIEGRKLLEAAHELELRLKRVSNGIETEIFIAVSDLFNLTAILEVIEIFYKENFGTRIKLSTEVFGGSWDALISGRADISIGAPGDAPSGGGFATKLIGQLEFVFAVAPNHPLANSPEPLSSNDIVQYRSVAAADSSRNLAPRTAGILTGQDVLTVENMQSKVQAQIMGLGVGYIPKNLANYYVKKGDLITKHVNEPKLTTPLYLAWRNNSSSKLCKSQLWLLKHFKSLKLDELML